VRATQRPEPIPITGSAATLAFTTLLTQGPLSRVEVGRRTGLSPAAVTKAVRPLLESGYLSEDRPIGAAIGRPATPLRVSADCAFFVGVKVTGERSSAWSPTCRRTFARCVTRRWSPATSNR
jgi:hypothetical protein